MAQVVKACILQLDENGEITVTKKNIEGFDEYKNKVDTLIGEDEVVFVQCQKWRYVFLIIWIGESLMGCDLITAHGLMMTI